MRETNWRDRISQLAVGLLLIDRVGPSTAEAVRPDFGLNALDFVELVLQVEQHFGFQFSAAQLADLRAVQLVLDTAERRLRRQLYAEFFAQLMHAGKWS